MGKQQGLTLVELIITMVVISVAIAGVVGAFSLMVGRSADPLWQTRSIQLGQAYLDEILAQPYTDQAPPGGVPAHDEPVCSVSPDTGEPPDEVDDYHGLSETPRTVDNDPDPAYASYQVEVSVRCAPAGMPPGENLQLKRIDVIITPPGQSAVTFSAYKGNY